MSPPDTQQDHITPYDRFAWSDSVVEHLLASGDHQRELIAYFGAGEYQALVALARESQSVTPAADAPRVFIVPGIMGSQLGLLRREPPNDVLWLDPVDISLGNLSLLRMPGEAEIVSLGVVLFTYLRLKLHLRIAGFAPVLHDYDWRLGVDELGRTLAARLSKEKGRVMIVAHSMGGLVSRAALACAGMDHVERVVLLGTPNSGSYAPLQALRGVYAVVRKIARLASAEQSAETLATDVFGTFPSLYHLLPPSGFNGGLDLMDAAAWPTSDPQPSHELLGRARALAAQLAQPDKRFANIVGAGQETVTSVAVEGGEFVYTITRHGDGTVPLACAELPGARTYYTTVAHSELARDAAVAHAIADILRSGETERLKARWAKRDNASARITDSELRKTHTGKVDWVHMEPEARQAFLRNLNEPPTFQLREAVAAKAPARAKPAAIKRKTPAKPASRTKAASKRKVAAPRRAKKSKPAASRSKVKRVARKSKRTQSLARSESSKASVARKRTRARKPK